MESLDLLVQASGHMTYIITVYVSLHLTLLTQLYGRYFSSDINMAECEVKHGVILCVSEKTAVTLFVLHLSHLLATNFFQPQP